MRLSQTIALYTEQACSYRCRCCCCREGIRHNFGLLHDCAGRLGRVPQMLSPDDFIDGGVEVGAVRGCVHACECAHVFVRMGAFMCCTCTPATHPFATVRQSCKSQLAPVIICHLGRAPVPCTPWPCTPCRHHGLAHHALHTMALHTMPTPWPCTPCLAHHALHTMPTPWPCTPCLAHHADRLLELGARYLC